MRLSICTNCPNCTVIPADWDDEERIRRPIFLPCADCAEIMGLIGSVK